MQDVVSFVTSLDSVSSDFSLASSFPRITFAGEHMQRSLSELQLAPQGMLFVQPHEDDPPA